MGEGVFLSLRIFKVIDLLADISKKKLTINMTGRIIKISKDKQAKKLQNLSCIIFF